jgi:hypothetical protein
MRTNYKRVRNILNQVALEVIESPSQGLVGIFDGDERVRVVLCDDGHRNHVGIHIFKLENSGEDLESHLLDAIETALKDNFPTIYVYMSPKPNEDRRLRRIETAKQWTKSNNVALQYALNKLHLDADKVLETMSEDQIDVLLAMVSGNSARASDERRAYWAPLYHGLRKHLISLGVDNASDIADEYKRQEQTKAVSRE